MVVAALAQGIEQAFSPYCVVAAVLNSDCWPSCIMDAVSCTSRLNSCTFLAHAHCDDKNTRRETIGRVAAGGIAEKWLKMKYGVRHFFIVLPRFVAS